MLFYLAVSWQFAIFVPDFLVNPLVAPSGRVGVDWKEAGGEHRPAGSRVRAGMVQRGKYNIKTIIAIWQK